MVAFQLPESARVLTAKTEKPVPLQTNGEWKSLNCKFKLIVDKEKTVLIMYHLNVKVDNHQFSVRLRVNQKFNVSIEYNQRKNP